MKSKERYTIISGPIPALVEVAEGEHRQTGGRIWRGCNRTRHPLGRARVGLGNNNADVLVWLAQEPTKRVAWLLGTAVAGLDASGTIIDQTERDDHDDSIAATHAHLGDEIFAGA